MTKWKHAPKLLVSLSPSCVSVECKNSFRLTRWVSHGKTGKRRGRRKSHKDSLDMPTCLGRSAKGLTAVFLVKFDILTERRQQTQNTRGITGTVSIIEIPRCWHDVPCNPSLIKSFCLSFLPLNRCDFLRKTWKKYSFSNCTDLHYVLSGFYTSIHIRHTGISNMHIRVKAALDPVFRLRDCVRCRRPIKSQVLTTVPPVYLRVYSAKSVHRAPVTLHRLMRSTGLICLLKGLPLTTRVVCCPLSSSAVTRNYRVGKTI
jgi:hypothetical protein